MLMYDLGDLRRPDPSHATAAYTEWVRRTRGSGTALVIAIECMDLFHFECAIDDVRRELIHAVQLKLATLASAPELLIHLDGPFFLVGFTATGEQRVMTLARHVLQATVRAARPFAPDGNEPVIALLRPTPHTKFEALLDRLATALVEVRRETYRAVGPQVLANGDTT